MSKASKLKAVGITGITTTARGCAIAPIHAVTILMRMDRIARPGSILLFASACTTADAEAIAFSPTTLTATRVDLSGAAATITVAHKESEVS